MSDITFSPIIPLIGGFPIGAQHATGNTPTQVISAVPFGANDALYINWLKQRGYPIDRVDFQTEPEKIKPVDFVICTPPCAGLSTLGRKKKGVDRADNPVNDWLYTALKVGIENAKAKVVIIENAPALSTKIGKPVLAKLQGIAEKAGYSTVTYRTTTAFHGFPQQRRRTFFFAFKGDKPPILPYRNLPYTKAPDVLRAVSSDLPQYEVSMSPKILECAWWEYLLTKFTVAEIRERMCKVGTIGDIVFKNGWLDDAIKYWEDKVAGYENESDEVKTRYDRYLHWSTHCRNKFSRGLGIFDSSARLYDDVTCTLTAKSFGMLHPDEDRSINVREAMVLMGMPNDFLLLNTKRDRNKIVQNVTVATAQEMSGFAMQFIEGTLPLSPKRHLFIDNLAHGLKMARDKKHEAHSLKKFI